MNHQLHTLYRALIDYRKNTSEDRECKLQRTAISAANSDTDLIEVVRKSCEVEEDWIEAIEKGLVFIEKAIKEERQFIRSNGEIIPIEKVKRTSKDSIEHLARHSDLITRLPEEGDDLTPDKLYTVERLSDYAVYENRFLYMLLCYLRDFISIRYEKILELTNTYKGKLSMNKTVVESNRKVVYEVNLEEERKNDDYLRENNQAQDAIDRMMTIYKAVIFFLNTPLMVEVAKAPMLKPPITRTNVLKMNRNFKEAVALYEYVSAYDKDGYEITTEVKKLSPFVGALSDEIAEAVELSSFLTYEYGLNIKELFKRHYEKEEAIKKEEERQKYAEQLRKIRRQIDESGLSPEEYIAMLEKRIKDLEDREEDIVAATNRIDELCKEIDRLNDELRHSKEKIVALKQKVAEWQRKYEEDMEAERIRHAAEVSRINEEHANQIKELCEKYEDEIENLKAEHENEVQSLHEQYKGEIDRLNEEHANEVQALHDYYTGEIDRINEEHANEVQALTEHYTSEIERINEEHANEVQALHEQYKLEIDTINAEHAYEISTLNDKHSAEILRLNTEHENLVNELNEKYNNEITRLKQDHESQVNALVSKYEKEIVSINALHDSQINTMQAAHAKEIAKLEESLLKYQGKYNDTINDLKTFKEKTQAKTKALKENAANKEKELKEKAANKARELKEKTATIQKDLNLKAVIIEKDLKEKAATMQKDLQSTIDEKKDELNELKQQYKSLEQQKAISDARLNAIRSEYGLMTEQDDFSTREATDEIEHQYRAFKKFFRTEWKQTKKKIRNEVFAGFTFKNAKKDLEDKTDVNDVQVAPIAFEEIAQTEILQDTPEDIIETDTFVSDDIVEQSSIPDEIVETNDVVLEENLEDLQEEIEMEETEINVEQPEQNEKD